MTENRCAAHRTQLAPWDCASCGLRCVKCVARLRNDVATWDECVACGGPVGRVMVPGPVDRLSKLLWHSVRAAIGVRTVGVLGAAFVGAIALRAAEASFVALVLTSVVISTTTAFGAFLLLQASANGPDEVESPGTPVDVRGLAAQVPWLALPFSVLIGSSITSDRGALAAAAFIVGATTPVVSLWRTLAPIQGARLCTTPTWIVPAVSSAALTTFAALCLRNAPDADRLGLVTTSVPLRSFAFLALLLTGWISGLFLHVRAREFGFPLPARFRVPLDPNAVPVGIPRPRAAPPLKIRAPIELD